MSPIYAYEVPNTDAMYCKQLAFQSKDQDRNRGESYF